MAIDEILAALESADTTSSFCVEKKIDCKNFDIKFNKIGALEFPISDAHIHALIAIAQPAKFGWKDQTILDKDVRDVWEIKKNKFKIGKKQWNSKIEPLLGVFKEALGLPKNSKLIADLHNMLVYEAGHFFKPHQDSEKVDGMVATLVIVLPTVHEGGELIIEHQGVKKTFKHLPSSINKLSCIAFYADCYHEVKEVTSGYRVSLTYNLILEKYKGSLECLSNPDFESKLETALINYFSLNSHPESQAISKNEKPKKMIYLLDHEYTQQSLSWDGLKGKDQVRVEMLLKLADKLGLAPHLALADLQETWDCEFDYNEYRSRRRHKYDDDEAEEGTPTYLIDSNTELKYWIDRQGNHKEFKAFSPSSSEVCWTGASDDLEPYKSDYEGWMGNYGNTLDRWYHRAAIVLWKKNDYYPILLEIDPDGFVQEIFSLATSPSNLTKVNEMLQNASLYWERYARGHKTEDDVINAMRLALYVNNTDISHNLLSPYELSIFNTKNIGLWVELTDNYSHQWLIDLLGALSNRDKAVRNTGIIKSFSDLIHSVLKKNFHPDIIDWLISNQFTDLKETHKTQRYADTSTKTNEITDFILGVIQANNTIVHLQAIHYIMENATLYPALSLVNLFEAGTSQLKPENCECCGYVLLFHYILKALAEEHRLGLRDKNDWSIEVKNKCNCANCILLKQFLNQRDLIEKIWPLPESSRIHVERELMGLCVPVSIRTERTGRPFKLILKKTEKLYAMAEERFKMIENALAQLNSFSDAHKGALDKKA